MKKTSLITSLLLILSLIGCNNSDQEIKTVVESFYKNYTSDHHQAKKSFLSSDLSSLMNQAIAKEKISEKLVIKSAHPTDKPDLIEGDIFSSLYEGPTSVSVGKIKTDGDTAVATANFKNATYKTSWQDEIRLVKEKTWKIDNVIYKGESPTNLNTKKFLHDFIKGE